MFEWNIWIFFLSRNIPTTWEKSPKTKRKILFEKEEKGWKNIREILIIIFLVIHNFIQIQKVVFDDVSAEEFSKFGFLMQIDGSLENAVDEWFQFVDFLVATFANDVGWDFRGVFDFWDHYSHVLSDCVGVDVVVAVPDLKIWLEFMDGPRELREYSRN